jgi:uncharacterized RDD family membrane protein YckC
VPGAAYGAGQPGNLLDRFVARLVDLIILAVVSGIIRTVLFNISDSYFLGYLVDAVITAAIYLGYFAYLESSRGQTLGKMIMKLKTVAPDGQSNPTMSEAVRRNIWTGAGILGVFWLPGYFLAFIVEVVAIILCAVGINSDPRRQHWFDKFAGGTQVLKIG